ncbi:porin [Persicobacter sp. CCB-QB2]|uniref:porin n=1 Tax=Persicobacter sp. CCB-QB2 TaxID=1561025 RepID=UPI00092F5941|nr:porin [Persicobacter sp. CCB-QB2]
MKRIITLVLVLFLVMSASAFAEGVDKVQDSKDAEVKLPEKKKDEYLKAPFAKSENFANGILPTSLKSKWFDKIKISGYAQMRYNDLYKTNPDMECEQCDGTYGGNDGMSFRRIRIKFSGYLHERVYFYIQPDFAGGNSNNVSLRDAYFDLMFTSDRRWRLRLGQSKVPFGFENMQSSQNRLSLDRNDAINSALKNERDMMAVVYYTPTIVQERFKKLQNQQLKGSGNYGMFALGAFNGQTANNADENLNKHIVTRLTYPFELANGQIFEAGIQAYAGQYVTTKVSEGVMAEVTGENGQKEMVSAEGMEWDDARLGASFIWYAMPFGFQTEYNVGVGPEYDPATNTIQRKPLKGGYAQMSYRMELGQHLVLPFWRYTNYEGGKKFETDARSYDMQEIEVGFEWQPNQAFELVALYAYADRTYNDSLNPDNRQTGSLIRLQAQINF